MATLASTAAPPAAAAIGRPRGLRLFDPAGGRTLDEAVRSALAAAARGGAEDCLVCGAAARPRSGGGLECPACRSALG